ncbi:MAG TPA: hypothetical protein VK681_39035 [Reyranella sp.]|nr:hypothetical protein [Reyranella sp.]
MTGPDKVTAKDEAVPRELAPEDTHQAICVDVIALGQKWDQYPGQVGAIRTKIALVWQLDAKRQDGKPFELSTEYTLSMWEKANLRRDLESWRGKPYTEEQAKEGIAVDKLVGHNALLTVGHKTSGTGKKSAKIMTVTKLPKAMPALVAEPYTRAPFWAKKKEEYAAEAAKHLNDITPMAKAAAEDYDDFPPPHEADDESLPF